MAFICIDDDDDNNSGDGCWHLFVLMIMIMMMVMIIIIVYYNNHFSYVCLYFKIRIKKINYVINSIISMMIMIVNVYGDNVDDDFHVWSPLLLLLLVY